MITVRPVPPDDPDAHRLWSAQQQDLAERYQDPDLELETSFPTLVGSWVGYDDDGAPVASLVARWSPYQETHPGDLELKRLWVEPAHRGMGLAKVMMSVAETAGRKAGATRLILETGTEQPESMALYERIGYEVVPSYGEYAGEPSSRCYALELPTRVLVVNGTIGAGKSTAAAAVFDAVSARGARAVWLDADALCQATPAPSDDPYNQELLFTALGGLAPEYRRRGFGMVVIARVVEDAAERDRYARVFRSRAGSAEVAIVRVEAPEDARLQRIHAREPAGYWQEWGRGRTVELQDVLEDLDLDDAVVETVTDDGDDRHPSDVAAEVMDAAGLREMEINVDGANRRAGEDTRSTRSSG